MITLATLALGQKLEPFKGLKYALLDYPNYLNPGDAAIWMGTRKILEELFSAPPAYVSSLKNFDAEDCKKCVDGGPVFFLGGGNFGDLYLKHNMRRLEIIRALSDNPIILLPLSIANAVQPDKNAQKHIMDVLSSHSQLTVFAREKKTKVALKKRYGLSSILCPDLAHYVDFGEYEPTMETLSLMRQDRERLEGAPSEGELDWNSIKGMKITNRIGKVSAIIPNGHLRRRAYDFFAAEKVRLAAKTLGSSSHINTDRLHAVILASNMGKTVTAHDNSTGKIAAYVSCWKDQLKLVSLSDALMK